MASVTPPVAYSDPVSELQSGDILLLLLVPKDTGPPTQSYKIMIKKNKSVILELLITCLMNLQVGPVLFFEAGLLIFIIH